LSLRKSSSRTRNYKEIEEILKYKIEELEGLDIVELGFDIGTD
jgi:hypothetical protein